MCDLVEKACSCMHSSWCTLSACTVGAVAKDAFWWCWEECNLVLLQRIHLHASPVSFRMHHLCPSGCITCVLDRSWCQLQAGHIGPSKRQIRASKRRRRVVLRCALGGNMSARTERRCAWWRCSALQWMPIKNLHCSLVAAYVNPDASLLWCTTRALRRRTTRWKFACTPNPIFTHHAVACLCERRRTCACECVCMYVCVCLNFYVCAFLKVCVRVVCVCVCGVWERDKRENARARERASKRERVRVCI